MKNDQDAINKICLEAIDDLQSQLKTFREGNDAERKSCEHSETMEKLLEADKIEMKQALEKEYQAQLNTLQNENKIVMDAHKIEKRLLTSKLERIKNKYESAKQEIYNLIQRNGDEGQCVTLLQIKKGRTRKKYNVRKKKAAQSSQITQLKHHLESSSQFNKFCFVTRPLLKVIKGNINMLLIGNTGCGKSATGNSILRRQCFKSVLSLVPLTNNISSEYYKFNNHVITVFDAPDFEDPMEDTPLSEKYFIQVMKETHSVNASGYHVFLIVFSAMRKLDASDMNLIRLIKKYFGADFISKFCVIVVTGGDLLNDVVFSQWCSGSTRLNKILLECGRIVLFNNKTKQQNKLEQHIEYLISLIDNLNYSDEELTVFFPDSITQNIVKLQKCINL